MDEIIIFFASRLHVVIVSIAVFTFVLATQAGRRKLFAYGILGLPFAYILGKIASLLYVTERPFVDLGISPLVPHIADNGFPSEHTLYAMAIALVVYLVNKKVGMLLVLLALLVGVGRILAHVHQPVDVVGSMGIAVLAMYTVRYVVELRARSVVLPKT